MADQVFDAIATEEPALPAVPAQDSGLTAIPPLNLGVG
jgi:hypothetical protein